jgi:hypothetical protein
MNVCRVLPLVSVVLLGVMMGSRPAVADTCATEIDRIAITLKKDLSTATGEQLGQFNCWMPKPPSSDKNLCQHDSGAEHTFSITLNNECDQSVKLMLKLKGGGSLDFKGDCGPGAVLFNDFVQRGASKRIDCTSTKYTQSQAKRATDYELRASHVDDGSQTTPVNVDYDPEIAVKDPSGLKSRKELLALAIIGGGMLAWFVARRFRRQAAP